jgi:hypothetical protein
MAELEKYFWGRSFVPQVGFYAPDWKAFAEKHHAIFGSGPFFYIAENTFDKLLYRGREIPLKLACCYGAWGDGSIEIVQQLYDGDSYYSEINDMDKPGINHLHMFVDDVEDAIKAAEALGYEATTLGWTQGKLTFCMVDMVKDFGCYFEFYGIGVKGMHDFLASAAKDWDGESDLFTDMIAARTKA